MMPPGSPPQDAPAVPSLSPGVAADPFANERWPEAPILLRRGLISSAIAAACGLLLLSGLPLCPAANLTGHPCPGCGLTRATLACLHGRFAEAYHLHPLVFLATPMVGLCTLLALHSYLKRGKVRFSPRVSRLTTPLVKVMYVALIGLWVVRFFGAFGGPVHVAPALLSRLF